MFTRLQTATDEFVRAGIVQNLQGEFDSKLAEILSIPGGIARVEETRTREIFRA
jgi:hypothetical protein